MESNPPLARPTQSLSTHLKGVVANARDLVSEGQSLPTEDSLHEVVSTVAWLHDFGKLTTWFQEYLERESSQPTARERHALVSAYITFHALLALDVERETAIAGFYAVAKHHSVLPNIREDHARYADLERSRDRLQRVNAQIENIDEHNRRLASEWIARATNQALSWADIVETDTRAYCDILDASWMPSDQFYPTVLRIWSTLTCADKMDAGRLTVPDQVQRPDPGRIAFDTDAHGITAILNKKRTQARQTAVKRGQELSTAGNQVFTLTLPTGFGKTFAGLETALRLAEDNGGRVIYALPYTTVIDQIHDEIVEQFGVEPDSEQYTIHHHLADTRTRVDDESVSDGTETLYGQTWQSGLILTTFVQLFESLAGPGNVQSIKLPALQDAVIVVDEPQTLPRRWWYLVSRLTTILVNEYNAQVIFMTATQPRLIEEVNVSLEPRELITDPDGDSQEEYFGFLRDHERVTFTLHESVQTSLSGTDTSDTIDPTVAGQQIVEATIPTTENVLAVNNTVASAEAVTQGIEQELNQRTDSILSLGSAVSSFYGEERAVEWLYAVLEGERTVESLVDLFLSSIESTTDDPEAVVTTLTAALRPCDRTLLIEAIRRILDPDTPTRYDAVPLFVSSTQLVEAGVDVSFDRLYRDFAPVPSLVQAAGRCNRSFEGDTGEVTVWQMGPANGETTLPSAQIYSRSGDRLRPARQALSDVANADGRISETEMITTANEAYYEYLHSGDYRTDQTDHLATGIDDARGTDLREASLIHDHTEEAIVLVTDADYRKLQRYLNQRINSNFETARQAFAPLKHIMASARPERVKNLDTTTAVLQEAVNGQLASGKFLDFRIIDARDSPEIYTIAKGRGIRE